MWDWWPVCRTAPRGPGVVNAVQEGPLVDHQGVAAGRPARWSRGGSGGPNRNKMGAHRCGRWSTIRKVKTFMRKYFKKKRDGGSRNSTEKLSLWGRGERPWAEVLEDVVEVHDAGEDVLQLRIPRSGTLRAGGPTHLCTLSEPPPTY